MKHTPEVESIIKAGLAREDAHTHDKWYVPAEYLDAVIIHRKRLREEVARLKELLNAAEHGWVRHG